MSTTIKCTYGDLSRLRDQPGRSGVLTKLLTSDAILTVVDRFRVLRLCRAAESVLKEYLHVLGELGKKYGDPVEKTSNYQIRPECLHAFEDEILALHATECELTSPPLPLSAYEKVDLTAADLDALEKFLVLPEGV